MGKGNPMEFVKTKFQGVCARYNLKNPGQVNQRLSSIHRSGRGLDASSSDDEPHVEEVSICSYYFD